MIAFHGKQEIKDKYLARVKARRLADEITKGIYWEEGKGCAIGCTIHSDSHASYETQLGIPMIIARLEDGIFEELPNDLAMTWPERFLEAVPVGADLSLVWPKFAVWLLTDVKQLAKTEEAEKAIQDVIDAYSGVVSGEAKSIDWYELRAAVAATYPAHAGVYACTVAAAPSAAAVYVVNSAGHAAAHSAAHSAAAICAAYSAAHSAAAIYAAYSAGHAAAIYAAYSAGHAAAAREKARVEQSEKLLEILRGSPTAHGK